MRRTPHFAAPPPGHGANSQFGPVRPTAEPSGHIFASRVQALAGGAPPGGVSPTSPGGVSPGGVSEPGPVAPGHSANSQLGPVRPTPEPSGQIFASVVHIFCSGWTDPPPPPPSVLQPTSNPNTAAIRMA